MSFRELDNYLGKCVTEKEMPGCVCWVGNLSTSFFFEEYGHAQIVPKKILMKKETVFDLASLTKPLATALSIMLMHERKDLSIDQCAADVLPSLRETASEDATIRRLLSHTSGLPAWYPTYLIPGEKRLKHLAGLNTGKKDTVYSCLGYIVLGKIIEQVSAKSIGRFLSDNVTATLGLHTLAFGPVTDRLTVAATEKGSKHEQRMARAHGDVKKIAWRKYTIQGEVHDGNAHYGYAGVAGNAGLFSNAIDLVALTRALLSGEILNLQTLSLMFENQTTGPEKRNLGWRVDPYPGMLSPISFGHTGFTGTMLLIDPETNLIIVLLANAIHPKVRLRVMQPIRENVTRIVTKHLNT